VLRVVMLSTCYCCGEYGKVPIDGNCSRGVYTFDCMWGCQLRLAMLCSSTAVYQPSV
jgi:hypothetical protein